MLCALPADCLNIHRAVPDFLRTSAARIVQEICAFEQITSGRSDDNNTHQSSAEFSTINEVRRHMNNATAVNGVTDMTAIPIKKPFYRILYIQVLFAIAIGIVLGHFNSSLAIDMKPLGDGFIKLIKMLIAPIVFCTVVSGIAGMQNIKKVG